jgi:hypothetical protein
MQTVEICTKNLKLRGKYRAITIKPNQNPTHKKPCRGNLDITYYTVPLLPVCKKNWAPIKIRKNKKNTSYPLGVPYI